MKFSFIFTILLFATKIQAQNLPRFISQNAIDIKSEQLFDKIKNYKCVMVGEMHGTQEPAAFLGELVKIAVKNGKKVILGIEIPSKDLRQFIGKSTTENLKNTHFFKTGYGDGRNNKTWFDLIETCKVLPNVELCFFDVDTISSNRDSVMFANLLKKYTQDTTNVIYTISGNIHNRLTPFNEQKTLGCYLVDYFSDKKIMSINHFYGSGTMYNDTGDGAKLHKVNTPPSIFATSTSLENYLLPSLPQGFMTGWTAILYTKVVTAAMPIEIE